MVSTTQRKGRPSGPALSGGPRQNSLASRDQLILEHQGFVRSVVMRIVQSLPSQVDAEGLESAGMLGLIEAAELYDEERRVDFRTYAYQRVRGAVLDELRRNCPLSQQMLQKVATLRRIAEEANGRIPVEDLAELSGLSQEEVTGVLQARRLSRPDPWDDSMRVAARYQPTVECPVERHEKEELLEEGIKRLPIRERTALVLFYNERLTQREIGDVLGVSESRVCRILDSARESLRLFVQEKGY